MSQKHSLNSIALAAVFALVIFVVALALFLFVGDYRILASMFMAFVVALLAGIFLFIGFGSPVERTAAAGLQPASAPQPAHAAPAPVAAAAPEPAPEPEPEPEVDPELEAARRKAEEEAAAIAARRQADEDAAVARQKAEADEAAEAERRRADEAAQAKKKAEEEAAAAAEAEAARVAAEDAKKAEEAAASGIPDYDGDGKLEGTDEGTRPAGLDAPRDGKADDLKQIKGIGPKLEQLCNRLGFWHFDQVAAWSSDEVAWVDANLEGFKGRVTRDDWVGQAKVLASGGETEFSKRVEDGDVY